MNKKKETPFDLKTLLEGYNATIIKSMISGLGKEPKKLKHDNVALLKGAFAKANRVQQALNQLNEPEKIILARVKEKKGKIGHERLRQLLSLHPDLLKKSVSSGKIVTVNGRRQPEYKANPQYTSKPTFEDVLAGLAYKGLLFSHKPLDGNRTTLDWLHGRTLYLPDYIWTYLPAIRLPELPNPARIHPIHEHSGSVQAFLRDLSRYGRYLRRKGSLRLTTQHQLYKDDLKAIAAEMSFKTDLGSGKKEVDNGRLFFLRCLLPHVDLAEQTYPTQPLTAVSQSSFWELDIPDRAQLAFQAWRDIGMWYELPQLNHYQRGTYIMEIVPSGLTHTRHVVLGHIANMGTGWINIHELINTIKDEDYGFLFEERNLRRWHYYSYQTGTPYESSNNDYDIAFKDIYNEQDGWQKVEADLINHIIAGPLYWLGLVDLGYMETPAPDLRGNKPVDGYRLTPMGEWLLGLGPKPEFTTEGGTVVIQPNFEVVVMAPFQDEILLTLDQFASGQSENEHVITYELSRDSVYRGQQQTWSVPRIIAWLESISQQTLPQNIRRSLEEWDALHKRITIRKQVTLLETSNTAVADGVAEQIPQAHARRVTPTVFLSTQSTAVLSQPLHDMNWLPLHTPAGKTEAPNSVTIDRNGRVLYTHPTPSIYAQRVITPLSTDTGSGRVLTDVQIKAAVSEGYTLTQLIQDLKAVHAGPLPDKLISQLKAWSHYYGDAHQEALILIEFKDEATCHELVHDPDLSQYLTPFSAHGRALATIHPLHVETVQALLAERGVTIHEGLTG